VRHEHVRVRRDALKFDLARLGAHREGLGAVVPRRAVEFDPLEHDLRVVQHVAAGDAAGEARRDLGGLDAVHACLVRPADENLVPVRRDAQEVAEAFDLVGRRAVGHVAGVDEDVARGQVVRLVMRVADVDDAHAALLRRRLRRGPEGAVARAGRGAPLNTDGDVRRGIGWAAPSALTVNRGCLLHGCTKLIGRVLSRATAFQASRQMSRQNSNWRAQSRSTLHTCVLNGHPQALL